MAAEVEWDGAVVAEFTEFILHRILTVKARKDLEVRARKGTGAEFLARINEGCCVSHHNDAGENCSGHGAGGSCGGARSPRFQKLPDDPTGEALDSLTTSAGLRALVPLICEKSAAIFRGVLAKTAAAGAAAPSGAAEAQLIREQVLREAAIRALLTAAIRARAASTLASAKDGGLVASPLRCEGDLDRLAPSTMRALDAERVAVQDRFAADLDRKAALAEAELLDYDGLLTDLREKGPRICWISQDVLTNEKHPALRALLSRLELLPFELNKKWNSACQAVGIHALCLFAPGAPGWPRHRDGGFGPKDTGRKITAIYSLNGATSFLEDAQQLEKSGPALPLAGSVEQATQRALSLSFAGDKGEKLVAPVEDRLVLIQTRHVDLCVGKNTSKEKWFCLVTWIPGVPGPAGC